MKLLYFKILIAVLFINPVFLMAQDDNFSNFKSTKAQGKAPAIFTTSFNDKVTERIESITAVEEESREDYAKYTNYGLNKLLQSGLVLYGDAMTKYVEKVAANLLKNEGRLRRDLQFYVIKSNITNALCTDPGVIFITTGLLSQVENEAQLAYVIAHEIVHYQKKHLQKSFSKSKESELSSTSSYEDLVLLSKDHESEADKDALKLYHAAGYSDKEVNTVFDVLMYSYLTFDEIDIDSSFFGNPKIYIPQSYFPDKVNPILAFEDYDDTKSSHPNIRKRKAAISDEIKKYSDWNSNVNFIDETEFKTIQNIARFESVRDNLLVADYIKALYEIYILEKQFPKNEYLQTSKALAWALMNQLSVNGGKKKITKDSDKKEGQISLLYGFIDKLNQEELSLLSLRQIEDVYKQFPISKRIEGIRRETIASLARLRNFKLDKLESVSFVDALNFIENSEKDTTANNIDKTENINETKYDRIRRIREQQNTQRTTYTELSDENFSLFLLYDLVNNGEFNEIYKSEKEKFSRHKVVKYSGSQVVENNETIHESDIIMLTPILAAEYKEKFDLDATLLFHEYFHGGVEKHAPKDRLKNLDLTVAEKLTTEKYNEVSLINSFLFQTAHSQSQLLSNLWIDHEEMNNLVNNYKDPYLLLISGEYYFNKFTSKAVTGNAKYIHITTGDIYGSRKYDSRYKLNKMSVEGFAHLIFSKFN